MKVHKRPRLLTELLPADAQERVADSLELDEIQDDKATLPDDLLFKIFILLPVESLYRIQFVCKEWLRVINSSVFIRCHVQKSETVLIRRKQTLLFSPIDVKSSYRFMDLKYRSDNFTESKLVDYDHIFASCDGLVLAKKKKDKSLILANPLTRKHTELPLGTGAGFFDDFYSLAFCKEANTYKIVHLFYTDYGYIGCEIMSVITRKWRRIQGISSNLLRLREVYQKPVSIAGSLYWIPQRFGCDYLVSLNVVSEKFVTMKLPIVCNMGRLVETEGFLGLVTHATNHTMEVWVLRTGGDSKENWIKRHSINLVNFDCDYPSAICSMRNGKEMVLACLHQSLYVYNCEKGETKLVYSMDDFEPWCDVRIDGVYIPHRNTLASWQYQS